MYKDSRTANVVLPGAITAQIEIPVSASHKLMFMDAAYLTNRVIVESGNKEMVGSAVYSPATVTLSDPKLAGRYVLIARNDMPHTNMEYCIYYDSKYKDILVMPSLEIYANMPYLKAVKMNISAISVSFGGDVGDDDVPLPNAGYAVKSTLASIANMNNEKRNGLAYENMLTPTLNFSTPSMYPTAMINFGLPSQMFPKIGFSAKMTVFGYSELTQYEAIDAGIQPIQDSGYLVVPLPL